MPRIISGCAASYGYYCGDKRMGVVQTKDDDYFTDYFWSIRIETPKSSVFIPLSFTMLNNNEEIEATTYMK